MIIVDAHLDIAYNALNHGRSPLHPVTHIRQHEAPDGERGFATVVHGGRVVAGEVELAAGLERGAGRVPITRTLKVGNQEMQVQAMASLPP